MRKWILLLAGVVALFIMAGGAVPSTSEAAPDCDKHPSVKKCQGVGSTPASGSLVLVETSTKTIGATTITWDSSFQDLDYTLGDTITVPVTWTVDAGAADFDSIAFKEPAKNRCTPKDSPAERALCSDIVNVSSSFDRTSGGSVTWDFTFTSLHCDQERDVEIGNAHFKLTLEIDKDGDGIPETLVGYGVNVHVEQIGCT